MPIFTFFLSWCHTLVHFPSESVSRCVFTLLLSQCHCCSVSFQVTVTMLFSFLLILCHAVVHFPSESVSWCCSLSFGVSITLLFFLRLCHTAVLIGSETGTQLLTFPSETVSHYFSLLFSDSHVSFTFLLRLCDTTVHYLFKKTNVWMVSDNWEITGISPSIFVSFIATSDMSNCAVAVLQLSSAATDEVERQQALQTKVTEHNSL